MRKRVGIICFIVLVVLGGFWFYQQAKTPTKIDTSSAQVKQEEKAGYQVKDDSATKEKVKSLPSTAKTDNPALMLVNKKHPLKSELNFKRAEINGVTYNALMKDQLENFLNDAKAAGYPATVVSAYRSIAYQQTVFDNQVNQYLAQGESREKALKETRDYIQTPGASEHHTGLGVDIMTNAYWDKHHALYPEADETKGQQWLIKHAPDYGFVLRYPKDVASRKHTGIAYESWHFRYVGVENARYMTENKLTLEEFWDLMEAKD